MAVDWLMGPGTKEAIKPLDCAVGEHQSVIGNGSCSTYCSWSLGDTKPSTWIRAGKVTGEVTERITRIKEEEEGGRQSRGITNISHKNRYPLDEGN